MLSACPPAGLERRRVQPGSFSQSGHQLEQGIAGRNPGSQPSSRRARPTSISGTPSAISSQPASEGCSRSLKLAAAPARRQPGGHAQRPCVEQASEPRRVEGGGSAARLNGPAPSPRAASRKASPTSWECTAWNTRRATFGTTGSSEGRKEAPGQQRAGEQAPDSGRRIALEDQAGSQPHHAHVRLLFLEAIEQALHLSFMARIERRGDASRGPALVDTAVLWARRIGTYGGGVDEGGHSALRPRHGTPARCRQR